MLRSRSIRLPGRPFARPVSANARSALSRMLSISTPLLKLSSPECQASLVARHSPRQRRHHRQDRHAKHHRSAPGRATAGVCRYIAARARRAVRARHRPASAADAAASAIGSGQNNSQLITSYSNSSSDFTSPRKKPIAYPGHGYPPPHAPACASGPPASTGRAPPAGERVAIMLSYKASLRYDCRTGQTGAPSHRSHPPGGVHARRPQTCGSCAVGDRLRPHDFRDLCAIGRSNPVTFVTFAA